MKTHLVNMTPLPPITQALRNQAKETGTDVINLHSYFMNRYTNEYKKLTYKKVSLDFFLDKKFKELEQRLCK